VGEAQAAAELARAEALAAGGSLAEREAEAARFARAAREGERRMAAAAVRRAEGERAAAQAALSGAEAGGRGERVALRAPADGVLLRLLRESGGPVAAGAPVAEVGDPAALEAELDLLTAQAVRVRPGAAAELVAWGGPPLPGRVGRIDPAAFTKVSALGVEEQRVHVVITPDGDPAGWGRLGDGWAVEGRVVVAARDDALLVPAAALFRLGETWAAFAVEGGRARLRRLEVGEQGEGVVAVTAGLSEGEAVVLHPSDRLGDGARVAPR
jgi:HlyD family secretion protein